MEMFMEWPSCLLVVNIAVIRPSAWASKSLPWCPTVTAPVIVFTVVPLFLDPLRDLPKPRAIGGIVYPRVVSTLFKIVVHGKPWQVAIDVFMDGLKEKQTTAFTSTTDVSKLK